MARHRNRRITELAQSANQYRVDPPRNSSRQRQHITDGVDLHALGTAERDKRNAADGNGKTDDKMQLQALSRCDCPKDCREHRRTGHHNTNIGRGRISKRNILQQIINQYTGQTRACKIQLMPLIFEPQSFGTGNAQRRKSQHKANEQNFYCRKMLEQDFCRNKGRTPHAHRSERKGMADPFFFLFHSFPFIHR